MQWKKSQRVKKNSYLPKFLDRKLNVLFLFKDIRQYFSIEAEQGMEQAGYEGSQVDRVG